MSNQDVDPSGDKSREPSALGHLVQRLKSQPMVLALGVLLILANVAVASVETLRALLPAAVAIFVVAVAAWLIVELTRLHRHARSGDDDQVRVSARGIGRKAEVLGIDDESGSATRGTSVDLKAKDVEGRVVGVRRGPPRP